MDNKIKIGILTFHNANNYGAILQCFALQNYLLNENFEVNVINYTPQKFKKVFYDTLKPWTAYGLKNKIRAFGKFFLKHTEMKASSQKKKKLDNFINRYLILTPVVKNINELEYDYFIVGSDQVWNMELIENDSRYLLDFVKNKKKISYAASFKISDVDSLALDLYKKNLPSFDFVSVREDNLVNYLMKEVGVKAISVLDPTFLMESWSSFISDRIIKSDYLLIYYVNMPKKMIDYAIKYAEKNNLKIVSLNKLNIKDYINFSNASIEEFLNLINYSTTVFTTSFHGMALSIQMKKDFYFEVPLNSYNNNERLLDLARKAELLDRNIYDSSYEKFTKIDWEKTYKSLKVYKEKSIEFLKSIK